MAKYDYSTNVVPVFIERKEEEIDAFPTQWTAKAGNANGKKLIFDVTALELQNYLNQALLKNKMKI